MPMKDFLRNPFPAALLLLLMYAVPLRAEEYSETRPLKVGVILPLSGDAANFGISTKNGLELALSELAAESRARLRFIFEDDGFSPSRTISAFNRLRGAENIDLIFNAGSQTAKALAPLTEQARMVLLAIASDPAVSAGRKFAFNYWVPPEEEAKILVPEAMKRGYRRIARISTVHDFCLTVNRAFEEENKGRLEIALSDDYPGEVKDFRTYITRLKSSGRVDAVLALLMPGQGGVFARQLRQMGVNIPLFGFEFFEDPAEVKASEGALVGSWYVSAASASEDFNSRYLARYPDASLFAAAYGYDAVLLLNEAVRRNLPRDSLQEFFFALKDFKGALGTYSANGRNSFTFPAAVKLVRENDFQELYSSQG